MTGMTSWAWVALGYGVTATAIGTYLIVLVRSAVRLRTRAEAR